MRNDINKELLSNIEISDEMKRELYENCRKHKSTADFRFKYSHLLSALIGVSLFFTLSIGAAAAVITVKQRLEGMSEEERGGYETEVENDTFVSTDEGFSRELTDSEILRIIELEREYYDHDVFPAETVAHLKTYDELEDGQLAYVEEDNMLYLPEGEMTDEQLLEYIDHDAKKWYVIRTELMAEGLDVDTYPDLAYESTPVEEGSMEERARDKAEDYVKEFYGVDVRAEDNWIVLVEFFPAEGEYDAEALYQVDIFRRGTGYANSYRLRLKNGDLALQMISCDGYEMYLKAKAFPAEEAELRKADLEEKIVGYLAGKMGFDMPSVIRYDDEEDTEETAFLNMELDCGTEMVYVTVRLEDGRVVGFNRFYKTDETELDLE